LKKPEGYNLIDLQRMLQTFQTLQPGVTHPATVLVDFGANVDALFQGDGGLLPPTVILDYFYGVAAYRLWKNQGDDVVNIMNNFHQANYAHIPQVPRALPDDTNNDTSGPDNSADPDYAPTPSRIRPTSSRRRNECDMMDAMDELNVVLMYINGITPEMAAERRQKEIEQEERAAREASRGKVMEWKDRLDVY
jgi:hypothetical protein